jgi:hypothetical protein
MAHRESTQSQSTTTDFVVGHNIVALLMRREQGSPACR